MLGQAGRQNVKAPRYHLTLEGAWLWGWARSRGLLPTGMNGPPGAPPAAPTAAAPSAAAPPPSSPPPPQQQPTNLLEAHLQHFFAALHALSCDPALALCIIGLWANVYPPGSHLSRHAHGTGAAARQADGSGDRQAQRLEQQGRKESLLVLRMCPNGGSCPVEFAHGMSGTGVVEQMGDGDMYGLSREGQGAVEVPALRADGGLISARVGDCCLHHAVTDHTNPTSGPTFVSIMVKVTHRGNLEDLMAALSRLYLEQPLPAIVAAAAAGNAEPPSSSSSSSFPFLFPSPCPSVMNFARGVGMRGWQGLKRATEEQLAEWGVQLGPKAANASMLYCPAVVECLMVHQLLQNPTFAAHGAAGAVGGGGCAAISAACAGRI